MVYGFGQRNAMAKFAGNASQRAQLNTRYATDPLMAAPAFTRTSSRW